MSGDLRNTAPTGCPDLERLKGWVDGELPERTAGEVTEHVAMCPVCKEETRIMRQIGEAVSEMEGQVEPPALLRQRILAGVTNAHPGKWWAARNPFVLIRWASLAGAVTVAVVVSMSVLPAGPGVRVSRTSGQKALPPVAGTPAQDYDEVYQARKPVRTRPEVPAAMAGGAAAVRETRVRGYVDGHVKLHSGAAQAQSSVGIDDVNTYTRGAPVDDVKRKVVRTAVLTVRTRSSLDGIQKDIEKRLKADEGYVESANLTTPDGGERTAVMRLRVPVDKLDEYVAWLSSLGEVQARNVRGEDVTGTWIDQRAEVRELRKEEARLLKVYNTDASRERRNEARWQLLRIRPRIAASEERFALTAKLSALSTVELTLIEPEQARIQGNLWQDLDSTSRRAISAFTVALRFTLSLLIWLVVFCPLWLPLILVYRWATRRAPQWQPR